MHGLLQKILYKRGIKDIEELSPEEQKTFHEWKAILSKEELNTKDIKEFCLTQVSMIENKWKDMDTTNAKKAELIPYFSVYRLIAQAIDSPQVAREMLERQLQDLLNN